MDAGSAPHAPSSNRRGRAATLEVRTNARACGVVLDGQRATGVRYLRQRGGAEQTVHARREVVLSAGTVNTARLLQVSGIGPAGLLGDIGVPVLHELRGVGENFRDHYAVRVVARAKTGSMTLNELSRGPRLAAQIARWASGRPSILATAPSHVHVFWQSFEGLDVPDLQCVFTPGSY